MKNKNRIKSSLLFTTLIQVFKYFFQNIQPVELVEIQYIS